MTGWRLGFVCAPKEISEAMFKIHQYTMMCASTMAQHAGIEALKHGIHLLKGFTPDVVEVLPATVPASVVRKLAKATGVPILGGGLVFTEDEVRQALASGICAVSTSQKSLWNMGG
jgi:hypothetical protein